MKKLLSMITILLVVIGISGCGNSAPKEVTVTRDQGNKLKLQVGKDIAEGEYNITTDTGVTAWGWVASQGSYDYNYLSSVDDEPLSNGYQPECTEEIKNVSLNEGDYLFLFMFDGDEKHPETGYNSIQLKQQ